MIIITVEGVLSLRTNGSLTMIALKSLKMLGKSGRMALLPSRYAPNSKMWRTT